MCESEGAGVFPMCILPEYMLVCTHKQVCALFVCKVVNECDSEYIKT